jgi:enterochelin esterase-like enzyme
MKSSPFSLTLSLLLLGSSLRAAAPIPKPKAQSNPAKQTKKAKKKPEPFKWINLPKGKLPAGVEHHTYHSRAMDVEIGYCIYLPPGYRKTKSRFPVVYYLHGGRPGSELKSVKLAPPIRKLHSEGKVAEAIYVFVNGGLVSHYDMPQQGSWGEWTFVKELIPHIDANFRTIARREARGLEGFSQGGRGTARIMFKFPELFISAAPGGGGHATEKNNSETGGWENENLKFIKGANTWDRARAYAEHKSPKLNILAYVGDQGFNYENNQEWSAFLQSLGIKHRLLIVPEADHSAHKIYATHGEEIMNFHMGNFAAATKNP